MSNDDDAVSTTRRSFIVSGAFGAAAAASASATARVSADPIPPPAPLADPLAFVVLARGTLRPVRRWRGRAMP